MKHDSIPDNDPFRHFRKDSRAKRPAHPHSWVKTKQPSYPGGDAVYDCVKCGIAMMATSPPRTKTCSFPNKAAIHRWRRSSAMTENGLCRFVCLLCQESRRALSRPEPGKCPAAGKRGGRKNVPPKSSSVGG